MTNAKEAIDDSLLLFGIIKGVHEELLLFKEVAFEVADHMAAVLMNEFTLTVHLSFTEDSFVFVTLGPLELTTAIQLISIEFASVMTTIRKDGKAFTMLLIADPSPFVLGHHAILVCLSREELESMTMTNRFKLLDSLRRIKSLDLSFVSWHGDLDELPIRLTNISDFTVVHGPVG